jgi:hypothetical protein
VSFVHWYLLHIQQTSQHRYRSRTKQVTKYRTDYRYIPGIPSTTVIDKNEDGSDITQDVNLWLPCLVEGRRTRSTRVSSYVSSWLFLPSVQSPNVCSVVLVWQNGQTSKRSQNGLGPAQISPWRYSRDDHVVQVWDSQYSFCQRWSSHNLPWTLRLRFHSVSTTVSIEVYNCWVTRV